MCIFTNAQSVFDLPTPNRYVNDYANLLTTDEENALEEKINAFDQLTSNQFAIVTVKSLEGLESSEFAFRLARQWGIGRKNKNNGVLILIKPKYKYEKGQVYIAIGYGLEASIPDAAAKRIVNRTLIPNFKKFKYYEGVNYALSELFDLSQHEYSNTNEYNNSAGAEPKVFVIFIIITILLPFGYMVFLRNRKIPEKYAHYYNKGEYNSKNIIEQIDRIEKVQHCSYPNFKSQLLKYEYVSHKNLFKYENRIEDKLFCILLNGRSRFQAFKEMLDPFLIVIVLYLIILGFVVSKHYLDYSGVIPFIISIIVSIISIYALLNLLISALQIYQFILRKKAAYSGGVSVAIFTLNALFKRNIERKYNATTHTYGYYPVVVFYSDGGGYGGGGFGGASFGGGGFGGGGAGGSW